MAHDIPDRPWGKVGTDMFSFNGLDYLITVDYYSGFWEIDFLENTTAQTVVRKMKSQFSRYGIPDEVISDSAQQYVGVEFKKFARQWSFQHKTSSPYHHQSNGRAEAAVKSAKTLLRKAKLANSDPYLAMLEYRNTPSAEMETSPAQRLMQRRTKTLLPTTKNLLKPKLNKQVMKQHAEKQEKHAKYYNSTAKDLPKLKKGDVVRIQPNRYKKEWQKAQVIREAGPRAYEVVTETGITLRRNRRYLRQTAEQYEKKRPEPQDYDLDSGEVGTDSSTSKTVTQQRPARNMQQRPANTAQKETSSNQPGKQRAQTATTSSAAPQVATRAGRRTKKPRYLQDYVTT
jgi:hypothetical protein